jgi:hypothetical protein
MMEKKRDFRAWHRLPAEVAQMIGRMPFAHARLVAAVGLWLATPWGAVVWLTSVVSMAVIELMFPAIYGGSIIIIMIEGVLLLGYLALAWMAAFERPP